MPDGGQRIYLIRHGETDGNRSRTFQVPETPLSAHGRRQASALAARLRAEPIAAVLTSDLARAHETASVTAEALGLPVESTDLLQERNFGELRGRSYEEVGLGAGAFAFDYVPPAGESGAVFEARVERAWRHVLQRLVGLEGAVAVFTHGLVCRVILERYAPPGPAVRLPEHHGNTGVSLLLGPEPWRAELVACTAHLEGDAADRGGIAGI